MQFIAVQVSESSFAGMKILREKKIKKKKNTKETSESQWAKILAKSRQQELKLKNDVPTSIAKKLNDSTAVQLLSKKNAVECPQKPMTSSKKTEIKTIRMKKTFGSHVKENVEQLNKLSAIPQVSKILN